MHLSPKLLGWPFSGFHSSLVYATRSLGSEERQQEQVFGDDDCQLCFPSPGRVGVPLAINGMGRIRQVRGYTICNPPAGCLDSTLQKMECAGLSRVSVQLFCPEKVPSFPASWVCV